MLNPLPAIPDRAPKMGSIWIHFKGHAVYVFGTSIHSETGEILVSYIELTSRINFSRPLSMWEDVVYDSKGTLIAERRFNYQCQTNQFGISF